MKKLTLKDRRHLDAAEGWIGLGNYPEASDPALQPIWEQIGKL